MKDMLINDYEEENWGFREPIDKSMVNQFFALASARNDAGFWLSLPDNAQYVELTEDPNVMLIGGMGYLLKYFIVQGEIEYIMYDSYNFNNIARIGPHDYVFSSLTDMNFVFLHLPTMTFTPHDREGDKKFYEHCTCLAVDPEKNIYYIDLNSADGKVNRLKRLPDGTYSKEPEFLIKDKPDKPTTPYSIAIIDGRLFVSDHCEKAVISYDLKNLDIEAVKVATKYDNQIFYKTTCIRKHEASGQIIFASNFHNELFCVNFKGGDAEFFRPKGAPNTFQFTTQFIFDTRTDSLYITDRLNKKIYRYQCP